MKYFEDMDSKYGFNEGVAIPLEAEKARTVYVKVMNVLLKKHNSNCRMISFEGGGFKNTILFLRLPLDVFNNLFPAWHSNLEPFSNDQTLIEKEVPADEGWEKAVNEANDMNLDDYLVVEVRISDDFKSLLEKVSG